MPFSDPTVRRTITALLGTVLLGTAVFFPFGSTSIAWTYEYNVERVTADDPHLASLLSWPDETAPCTRDLDACELAYRVRDDGSQVVPDATYRAARGFSSGTEVVILDDTNHVFYRPNVARYENDSTRIELKPISNATALALASTPARKFPIGVQRVIAEEQVRTNHPLTGVALWDHTHAIISYDGEYYRRGSFAYRGTAKSITESLRLLALALGAVCCFRAGRIT